MRFVRRHVIPCVVMSLMSLFAAWLMVEVPIMSLKVSAATKEAEKRTIDVTLDAVDVRVNGDLLDTPTISYGGVTYVPLREVAERLGARVTWDDGSATANILLDGAPPVVDEEPEVEEPDMTSDEALLSKLSDLPLVAHEVNYLFTFFRSYNHIDEVSAGLFAYSDVIVTPDNTGAVVDGSFTYPVPSLKEGSDDVLRDIRDTARAFEEFGDPPTTLSQFHIPAMKFMTYSMKVSQSLLDSDHSTFEVSSILIREAFELLDTRGLLEDAWSVFLTEKGIEVDSAEWVSLDTRMK